MFFANRRPRRFQHKPIYYDERKDMLRQLEQRAKAEVEGQQAQPNGYADMQKTFGQPRRNRYSVLLAAIFVPALLAVLMCLLFIFLA